VCRAAEEIAARVRAQVSYMPGATGIYRGAPATALAVTLEVTRLS
jgi:hypothetical protein